MDSNKVIVVYTGGTAGDLVASVIDSNHCGLSDGRVLMASYRQQLKQPHLFRDDTARDDYVKNAMRNYRSLPSHSIEYHLQRQHNIVGITVEQKQTATWAAERFKRLHKDRVWKAIGLSSVDDYANMLLDYSWFVRDNVQHVVSVEDILNGHLLDKLNSFGIDRTDQMFYNRWIDSQKTAQ